MATAVNVLDRTRFEARARVVDIVALGLVMIVGAALVFDMYSLGYTAASAAALGGEAVLARDRGFVIMIIKAFVASAGLCWIAYRLLTTGARRVGG